jgi:hypothetical protein
MIIANLKRGDLRPQLRLRLMSAGVGVQLSEASSIAVNARLPGSPVMVSREVVVDEPDEFSYGFININLSPGDTEVAGTILFEVVVQWPGNKPQTWPSSGFLKVRISKDLI